MTPFDAALFVVTAARPSLGAAVKRRFQDAVLDGLGQPDTLRAQLLVDAARNLRNDHDSLRTLQRAREILLHPTTTKEA